MYIEYVYESESEFTLQIKLITVVVKQKPFRSSASTKCSIT